MTDPTSPSGPLAGITVVALEHAVAVPMATRQLADLGARVIKIERVDGGDFARGYDNAVGGSVSSVFLWTSRGKESLAVDVKSPQGRQLVLDLVTQADVFIQNLSPGAVERLGLGPEDLTALNERLIYISNSGYGSPGPYAGKRAYDALVQAEAGVVAVTGTEDEMVKPGFSAADVASGMYMFSAALTGLYQREHTQRGGVFEVTMLDAMTDFIANHIYYAQNKGEPASRLSLGHPSLVPYGEYSTLDGRVVVGVQNDREWRRFAEAILGGPELADDPRFATNVARAGRREEVDGLVARACASYTSEQLTNALDAAQIACAKVNLLPEVAAHPQLSARDRWVETPTPAGPAATLRPVITQRGVHATTGAVPALGEHTRSILRSLEYHEQTIEDLVSAGIVLQSA
jgi:crotonobetainyl-CoA:carnitine CoA-transferase CaiB-like acyl-CoA transferase